MFSLIEKLFFPKSNAPGAAKLLADILQVKITRTTLKNEIEAHPDYPSLLSISDVLTHYGIENVAIKLDAAKLSEAPVPFITQIKVENDAVELFSVVKAITLDTVSFFDPIKHTWTAVSRESFWEKCSGTVLLAAADEQAGEKEYDQIIALERRKRITLQLSLSFLPGVALVLGVLGLMQNGAVSFLPVIFLILALLGAVLGVVLIWYE